MFIKLTQSNGELIIINLNNVDAMMPRPPEVEGIYNTRVDTVGNVYWVKETIQEIKALITEDE